jgi:hypothetical protein
MSFCKLFAAGFVSCLMASASASTVWIDMQVDSAGTFQVFLSASAEENYGIASYGVSLAGGVQSIDHVSPKAASAIGALGEADAAGFTLFRSSDNDLCLTGAQGTVFESPNLIRGFGQSASSFAEQGMTDLLGTEQTSWAAPLLIASGSWADTAPSILFEPGVVLGVNVFREATGIGTMSADLVTRINGEVVSPPPPPEPEPDPIVILPEPMPQPPEVVPPEPLPNPEPAPNPLPGPIVEIHPGTIDDPILPEGPTIIVVDPSLRDIDDVVIPDGSGFITFPIIDRIDVDEWIDPIAGGWNIDYITPWGAVRPIDASQAVDADDARVLVFFDGAVTRTAVAMDGASSAFLFGNKVRQTPEPVGWCLAALALVGAWAVRWGRGTGGWR